MTNYYKETIEKIRDLIDQEKYLEAQTILKQELDVPYIPEEYENVFLSFKKEVDLCLRSEATPVKDRNAIIHGLFSNNHSHQLESVMQLSELDIKMHDLDFINLFFKHNNDVTLKTLLFQILISKNIDYDFSFKNNKYEFKINPIHTKPLSSFYNKSLIEKCIYNLTFKEPSLQMMCESLLDRVLLKTFPKLLPDSGEKIANDIVSYCRSKLYNHTHFPDGHFAFLDSVVEEQSTNLKN